MVIFLTFCCHLRTVSGFDCDTTDACDNQNIDDTNILCTAFSSCSDATLYASSHVYCLNQYSCRNANITTSFTNDTAVYCGEYSYSCVSATIRNAHIVEFIGSGNLYSCQYCKISNVHRLLANPSYSLKSGIIFNVNYLQLSETYACIYCDLASITNLQLIGFKSCQNCVINNANYIAASGRYSCLRCDIYNAIEISATQEYSLANAVIRTSADGTVYKMELSGDNAANEATLYCYGTDICNIYCSGTGCYNLNVYCWGDCNVQCQNGTKKNLPTVVSGSYKCMEDITEIHTSDSDADQFEFSSTSISTVNSTISSDLKVSNTTIRNTISNYSSLFDGNISIATSLHETNTTMTDTSKIVSSDSDSNEQIEDGSSSSSENSNNNIDSSHNHYHSDALLYVSVIICALLACICLCLTIGFCILYRKADCLKWHEKDSAQKGKIGAISTRTKHATSELELKRFKSRSISNGNIVDYSAVSPDIEIHEDSDSSVNKLFEVIAETSTDPVSKQFGVGGAQTAGFDTDCPIGAVGGTAGVAMSSLEEGFNDGMETGTKSKLEMEVKQSELDSEQIGLMKSKAEDGVIDERNYQMWNRMQVVKWVKMHLEQNGIEEKVMKPFLKELYKHSVTGQVLERMKQDANLLDPIKLQFSEKNQRIGVWMVVKYAVMSIGDTGK